MQDVSFFRAQQELPRDSEMRKVQWAKSHGRRVSQQGHEEPTQQWEAPSGKL